LLNINSFIFGGSVEGWQNFIYVATDTKRPLRDIDALAIA
jgi:hypothetical protein